MKLFYVQYFVCAYQLHTLHLDNNLKVTTGAMLPVQEKHTWSLLSLQSMTSYVTFNGRAVRETTARVSLPEIWESLVRKGWDPQCSSYHPNLAILLQMAKHAPGKMINWFNIDQVKISVRIPNSILTIAHRYLRCFKFHNPQYVIYIIMSTMKTQMCCLCGYLIAYLNCIFDIKKNQASRWAL